MVNGKASVKFDPNRVGQRDIIDRINEIGFEAVLEDSRDNKEVYYRIIFVTNAQIANRDKKEMDKLLWMTISAACFALPTFTISMILMMFLPTSSIVWQWLMHEIVPGLTREVLITFILATPVQFIIVCS